MICATTPPKDGNPTFANIDFKSKRRINGKFGLYGIFFDERLIYIGSFTGGFNSLSDITNTRWKQHLGAISLRSSKISLSLGIQEKIKLKEYDFYSRYLFSVNPKVLSEDKGNQVSFDRAIYAIKNWDFFSKLDGKSLKFFDFLYFYVDNTSGLEKDEIKKILLIKERFMIEKYKPLCNSINPKIEYHNSNINSVYDFFDNYLNDKVEVSSEFLYESKLKNKIENFSENKINKNEREDKSNFKEISNARENFINKLYLNDGGEINFVNFIENKFNNGVGFKVTYAKPRNPDLRVFLLPENRCIFRMEYKSTLNHFRCMFKYCVNEKLKNGSDSTLKFELNLSRNDDLIFLSELINKCAERHLLNKLA